MIDIAAQAGKDGVKIPTVKATREAIVNLFKQNLITIKKRLNVSAPLDS